MCISFFVKTPWWFKLLALSRSRPGNRDESLWMCCLITWCAHFKLPRWTQSGGICHNRWIRGHWLRGEAHPLVPHKWPAKQFLILLACTRHFLCISDNGADLWSYVSLPVSVLDYNLFSWLKHKIYHVNCKTKDIYVLLESMLSSA